jgi:hypothetical protein
MDARDENREWTYSLTSKRALVPGDDCRRASGICSFLQFLLHTLHFIYKRICTSVEMFSFPTSARSDLPVREKSQPSQEMGAPPWSYLRAALPALSNSRRRRIHQRHGDNFDGMLTVVVPLK